MREEFFTRSQIEKTLQYDDPHLILSWGLYTDPS